MEKIRERSMVSFVLSSLVNIGIGFVFGLFISIIMIIATRGIGAWNILLNMTGYTTLIVGLFASNMYRLYFYYRISLDIDSVCEGDGEESESYVTALVLGFLTLGIYQIFWTYKLAKRLRANAPRYGFKMLETGKDIVILNVLSFGFFGTWELIKYMNRISKVYNQNGLAEVVGGVQ